MLHRSPSARARIERAVDNQTLAFPFSPFVRGSRSRVPGILMCAEEQHRSVPQKQSCVPLPWCTSQSTMRTRSSPVPALRMPRRDRHVVEEAKSHAGSESRGDLAGAQRRRHFLFFAETPSTAFKTPPAARSATSSDFGMMSVSPVESTCAPRAMSRFTISRYSRACTEASSSSVAGRDSIGVASFTIPARSRAALMASSRSGRSECPSPGACCLKKGSWSRPKYLQFVRCESCRNEILRWYHFASGACSTMSATPPSKVPKPRTAAQRRERVTQILNGLDQLYPAATAHCITEMRGSFWWRQFCQRNVPING